MWCISFNFEVLPRPNTGRERRLAFFFGGKQKKRPGLRTGSGSLYFLKKPLQAFVNFVSFWMVKPPVQGYVHVLGANNSVWSKPFLGIVPAMIDICVNCFLIRGIINV
jgi:hypothetical protein